MGKSDSSQDNPLSESDGLLQDGWGSLDDGDVGEFASEHTTVDPKLLDRLVALDKGKGLSAKPKALERRDKTINLDISELLAMEEESDVEVPPPPASPPKLGGADLKDAPLTPLSAMSGEQKAIPRSPTPKSDSGKQPALKAAADAKPASPKPEPQGAKPKPAPHVGSLPAPGPSAGSSQVKAIEASNPSQPSVQIDSAVADDPAGDFSSEKTQIFVAAMDDEPTRAKLRVVQGGGQQKEYLLARDRITIGRGTNNDIPVPDIAMSRQHCEIKRLPDGSFHLTDLNSGNGTKLNSTRVLDAALFGGDRIEMGNTTLEFVLTGPGASRPPGQRRINVHPSDAGASNNNLSRRATGANPAVAPAPAPMAPAPIPNYSSGQPGYNATATHFQFQQQMAAQQPANNRSMGLIAFSLVAIFSLFILALASVVGAKIYMDYQSNNSAGAQVNNKPASAYFSEGSEHVKTRNWDKAEEKFTIAADLAKEERDFAVRKDAELQLERVRAEKSNQKALERARSLIQRGQYPEAITRLGDVGSGSVYDDDAQRALSDARKRYADELCGAAQKAFEAKNFDEADKKIALALSTLPEHPPALALRKKIDNLPSDSYTRPTSFAVNDPRAPRRPATSNAGGGTKPTNRTPTVAARPSGGQTPPATGSKPPAPTTKPPASSKDSATAGKSGGGSDGKIADFAPGLSMYRGKRYQEAIAYFNNIAARSEGFNKRQAETLARNVASFQQNFATGTTAYSGSQWSGATRALTIAYRLDKSISGSGYHGAELREKLAESHYQLAKAAFDGQNFARAGTNAKKVAAYKPSHPGNAQLLSQLESKGRSMYIDALNRKDSDPVQARRIAKAITEMLPANSDTHKKAKQLLAEL